jgi:hypothetical protein
MTDFDYKKYSLENLEKWMSDALLSSEATPQEIYDIIRGVVHEEYHYFKHQTGRCYELLALLGGTNNLQEQVKAQGEVWDKEDDGMHPWGHSDLEYMIANPTLTEDRISNFPGEQYSEEELNAMCDKAASGQEKDKCREYNLREAEYYNQRAQLDTIAQKIKEVGGYDWSPLPQKDKVVKWQLPVEIDGTSGEYYIQFPDDLMEASGIKENDMVEWIDRKDGSFELRKVNGPK